MDNARKACDENGTITLTGEETTEGYRFRLQDDGSGMEEEEVRKITEAFYMVDKSRARREGGVGLGLALCQRIVELHHARWKIESSLRKGTAVEILFLKKGK